VNAETFNSLHPVGSLVFAYPGARPEGIPSTRRLVTRTRTKAQSVGLDRDGVVWVEGHGAYISLTHVDVITEAEWEAAKLADAVAAKGALPMPVRPVLSDERLSEIKSLLRYETSISFHSARAKESMLLLVAEVERQRARIAELERPAVEAERNAIRQSYRELAHQAREDRDFEGAFDVDYRLREREAQWAREDAAAALHGFEKEYQGESDAKRRPANCKHCGQGRSAAVHAEVTS
jgi:hypothetical protein